MIRTFGFVVLLGSGLLMFGDRAAASPYMGRVGYHPALLGLHPSAYGYPHGTPFINTSWQNNPYVYWNIHHHYPIAPLYPSYYNYGYYNYPSYYPYPVYVPTPVPVYPPGPDATINLPPSNPPAPVDRTGPQVTAPPNAAALRVTMPTASALLYVDGVLTTSTGAQRGFVSPILQPGQEYRYTLKAVWTQDGQQQSAERSVLVSAGKTLTVDFTRAN